MPSRGAMCEKVRRAVIRERKMRVFGTKGARFFTENARATVTTPDGLWLSDLAFRRPRGVAERYGTLSSRWGESHLIQENHAGWRAIETEPDFP